MPSESSHVLRHGLPSRTVEFYAGALYLRLFCFRLSFADALSYCADTAQSDVPILGLLDKDYGKKRASLLNTEKTVDVCVSGICFIPQS